jgi:hypothetical protein
MEQHSSATGAARAGYAIGALLTVGALYLVWAAFHDIAAGETNLEVEYLILVLCAVWFFILAIILVRGKHRLLGLISVVAIGAGLWGQGVVGSAGTGNVSARLIAISGAFLWFLLLVPVLGFFSWWVDRQPQKGVEP